MNKCGLDERKMKLQENRTTNLCTDSELPFLINFVFMESEIYYQNLLSESLESGHRRGFIHLYSSVIDVSDTWCNIVSHVSNPFSSPHHYTCFGVNIYIFFRLLMHNTHFAIYIT